MRERIVGRLTQAREEHATDRLRRAGATIAPSARIAAGTRMTARTTIGHHTTFTGPAKIAGAGNVRVGPYCAIGEQALVMAGNHDTGYPNVMLGLHWRHGFRELDVGADVEIGAACWLGDRVAVMPGARIGCGVVVAAGAVVTGTVPDFTLVGGVPAKLIRERCSREVASALVELAWWEWPEDRIGRNRAFFETPIADVSEHELRRRVVP